MNRYESSRFIALSIGSVLVNLLLMMVKIVTGVVGNSYALVADGIESAADVFSSIVTWAGFHLSLRPADASHPFGHGRIETLAGVFAGLSLFAAAGFIAFHSVLEIRNPHHAPAWFTLPVLLVVILIKLLLSHRLAAEGNSVQSRAIQGEAWHHRADAISSIAAAVGISAALIGGEGWEAADDWAALLACSVIVFNALKILRTSLHDLLDGRVDQAFEQALVALGRSVEGVEDIETCRVRKSGVRFFAELHTEVNAGLSVARGHEIAHEVKAALLKAHPALMDVVVHVEPAKKTDPRTGTSDYRKA